MNATSSMSSIGREAVRWSILLSILMIVAGVLAITAPAAAGTAVTIIVGVMLIFSGVAHFAFGWETRDVGGMVWEMLLGVLYVVVGVYLLSHVAAGLTSLTLALAVYLFLEAVLEFVLSFQFRPLPGSGWLLVDGVVTLILAIAIWKTWPSNTPWVIGTIVGVSMLFSGITRLALSLSARDVVGKLPS